MSRQDKHKVAATLRAATHKNKLLLHKSLMLLPAAATLGILALVSVLLTSADTASNTYAANLGSQITTEVDGQYYVTLTAPDVNFSVSPSKNENAAKQRIDVNVETNVAGGAKLYLSMAGSSNSLHLNGNIAQASPVIAAVPDNTDASSFPANTWGYSTDDQTYSAVPTTASDPALLANVDGETTGTTSGSVISASIPVYYAANVDTSIPSGSYSNRMTYSAVVDGGITAEAELTRITVDRADVENMQAEVENTLEITTNLMTNTYGTPRVYLETTDPAGYQECGDVVVSRNESGYMTITCKVRPTQAATGVALHIVPKGSSDDRFCTDNTYQLDTSDCEAGNWKWGSFVISTPDIAAAIFNGITTMQEMTPEICAAAKEGDTMRLQDTRDDKMYWVAKLKDGNCWMTQNLDLDLSTSPTLTPANSDVSSNRTFNGGWYTSPTQGSDDSTVIQGWDLGEWVRATPTGINSADFSTQGFADFYGFTNVSSMAPMTEAINEGRSPGNNVVIQGNQYDAHFLVGNHYSWGAATAGSGNSLSGDDDATDSICPAGWHLPLSSSAYDTTSGSFYNLFSQYGLTSSVTNGNNNISTASLYFVRSGYVAPGSQFYQAGLTAAYWTRRASSPNVATYLRFDKNVYLESLSMGRATGLSVRCVAGWE